MARSVSYGGPQLLNTFFSARWSSPTSITNFFIEIDWKCSQITDHPGERGWAGTVLTHSRLARVSVSDVWWSLCIIGHCHQDSLFPITMLFLMPSLDSPSSPLLPEFLGSPACPAQLPWLALVAAQTLGSVTRLKTQQFLGELYRNNIYTWVEIVLVGCITFN